MLEINTDPTATWKTPLIIWLSLAISSTLIFWFSNLDIYYATAFYAPPPAIDPWPQELVPLWRFFYYSAPVLAMVFSLGALVVLIVGRARPQWRSSAACVLLTFALGPGLLVNLVFKDHWGRPRPRQLEIFGGSSKYLPPLAIGNSNEDKSFPAGHASVGFSLCVFWFLWRRRRPTWAWLALGVSLLLGLLMGLGRMATGSHFLSDVLWAGYICFFIALIVYYFVLRVPYWEEQTTLAISANNIRNDLIVYTGIGVVLLLGAMLGFPIDENIDYRLAPGLLPLQPNLRLDLRYAQLVLHLGNTENPPMRVTGTVRGFGLPTYRIDSRSYMDPQSPQTLVYQFRQRGFFTELKTKLDVYINVSGLKRLTVHLREGDIRTVITRNPTLPQLDLHTNQGQVLPPSILP